jgi:dipeptidyl aminopeptidase/acylaminoacyl peptidase
MRLRSVLLCSCFAACCSIAHAAARLVPLSAFVNEDQYTNPQLSPDGKHIAITMRSRSGERSVPVLMIFSLPDLKVAGGVRMPVFQVPLGYLWVSNTRLALTRGLEMGAYELPQGTGEVLATEFDGTKQEYLYGYNMARNTRRGAQYGGDEDGGYMEALPQRNGHIFLTAHKHDGKKTLLYDIDSVNAERHLVAELPEPGLRFLVQHNGKPRFGYGTGEDANAITWRYNDTSAKWEKLDAGLGKRFEPTAFSADDSEFVAVHSADGGPDQLVKENLASGARTTLFADARASVDDIMVGASVGLPFGASANVGIPSLRYFDAGSEDAKLHQLLSAQFPDSFVRFINTTQDGNTLLFSVASDRDPGSYYVFHKQTMSADLLFTSLSKIAPADMAERRPIAFKSRDGLDLYGYLTMPLHPPAAKLPMVVLPHGGPHGDFDTWFFHRDAQFLANRGYAVLQVNYRGSGGRGVDFQKAGYRQWGAKIQDDLVDGARWAIAQGEVDGGRVCAYGVGFGAYSALMLAAREPALFKCAVGYGGIYDLNLLYKADGVRSDKSLFNTIVRHVGQDKDELNRFSPVALAASITAPVLLVHGGKDETAPPAHAEAMRAALVKVNRAPEWLYAPAEGHGFYNTDNVTMFYEKLEAFLARHIGK